jgi:Abortive infection alpha
MFPPPPWHVQQCSCGRLPPSGSRTVPSSSRFASVPDDRDRSAFEAAYSNAWELYSISPQTMLARSLRRYRIAGMADEHQNKKLEVNIPEGKCVSENTWDDILPAVKPGVAALGNILSVAANATGLTAEIFNDVIDNMRKMYREQVFRIPEEHRRRPPYRITSEVLEETVKCVEERELHKLFVNLLTAASDDRRTGEAHPGFAKAIGQLTPLDAKVINALSSGSHAGWSMVHAGICSREEFEVSQINLIQLGIAEWEYERLDSFLISNATDGFGSVNVKIPRQTCAQLLE